jgi:hypothetical protein
MKVIPFCVGDNLVEGEGTVCHLLVIDCEGVRDER